MFFVGLGARSWARKNSLSLERAYSSCVGTCFLFLVIKSHRHARSCIQLERTQFPSCFGICYLFLSPHAHDHARSSISLERTYSHRVSGHILGWSRRTLLNTQEYVFVSTAHTPNLGRISYQPLRRMLKNTEGHYFCRTHILQWCFGTCNLSLSWTRKIMFFSRRENTHTVGSGYVVYCSRRTLTDTNNQSFSQTHVLPSRVWTYFMLLSSECHGHARSCLPLERTKLHRVRDMFFVALAAR